MCQSLFSRLKSVTHRADYFCWRNIRLGVWRLSAAEVGLVEPAPAAASLCVPRSRPCSWAAGLARRVTCRAGEGTRRAPRRALRDFARVSVPAGGEAAVSFALSDELLRLVNRDGGSTLYPGEHTLILGRGAGGFADDAAFTFAVT